VHAAGTTSQIAVAMRADRAGSVTGMGMGNRMKG
jgi:hypothetical protein